eukprot:gene4568-4823_t
MQLPPLDANELAQMPNPAPDSAPGQQQQQQAQPPQSTGTGGWINTNRNNNAGWNFNNRNPNLNRGFPGFEDPADLQLLQDLELNSFYQLQDRWYPEEVLVEVEEDLSPKFVNGKRVLDAKKVDLGVMSCDEARQAALQAKVDVVLINDSADPPVVRLMEFGKYKFELERAAKQKQKSSKGVETKEVRLRPVTEPHDYEVKVKAAKAFLAKGSKVKLTMQFNGREMRFKEQGKEMMLRLIDDLSAVAKMDAPLNLRTSTFSTTLSPVAK